MADMTIDQITAILKDPHALQNFAQAFRDITEVGRIGVSQAALDRASLYLRGQLDRALAAAEAQRRAENDRAIELFNLQKAKLAADTAAAQVPVREQTRREQEFQARLGESQRLAGQQSQLFNTLFPTVSQTLPQINTGIQAVLDLLRGVNPQVSLGSVPAIPTLGGIFTGGSSPVADLASQIQQAAAAASQLLGGIGAATQTPSAPQGGNIPGLSGLIQAAISPILEQQAQERQAFENRISGQGRQPESPVFAAPRRQLQASQQSTLGSEIAKLVLGQQQAQTDFLRTLFGALPQVTQAANPLFQFLNQMFGDRSGLGALS